MCYYPLSLQQFIFQTHSTPMTSHLPLRTPKKSSELLTRAFSFANIDNQQQETSIIQLLLTDDESQFQHFSPKSPRIQPKRSHGLAKLKSLPQECFRNNIPPVNHSPSYNQNSRCFKSNSKSKRNINVVGKKRLEMKYEEALEKLTELRLHYDIRKHEKAAILSHKHQ